MAAGLVLVPGVVRAQDAAQPATTNTPSSDTVGPRELQNFSLPGPATKPADQPSAQPPSNADSAVRANVAPTENLSSSAAPDRRSAEVRQAARTAPPPPAVAAPPAQSGAPSTEVAAPLPQPSLTAPASAQPAGPASALAPETPRQLSMLPWIVAALVLAAGILFLLWRRRPRQALAAGPEFDLFVPPAPAPEPPAPPAPAPRASVPQPPPRAPAPPAAAPLPRPAAPVASSIVASRLRPSLEIGMQPLRCVVDESQVTIEFEVELFNAGTAPARAVLAEASLLNAGATQDQELARFFANPAAEGDRIDAIPPMKRIAITSRVVAPRSAVQEYELAGRKAYVPVIAFNALYEGSGGKAQSSAAYLVGRETKSDKLGPLRLDAGAREFRGLGARPLPVGVRT